MNTQYIDYVIIVKKKKNVKFLSIYVLLNIYIYKYIIIQWIVATRLLLLV